MESNLNNKPNKFYRVQKNKLKLQIHKENYLQV